MDNLDIKMLVKFSFTGWVFIQISITHDYISIGIRMN